MKLTYIDILKKYSILRLTLNYIINNSTSNYAPYHNIQHVLFVMEKCYEGATFHNIEGGELKELLIAALLHDFDHTCGKENDKFNVQLAIDGVDGLKKRFDGLYEIINFDEIKNIIAATEYPYTINKEDLDIKQAIIRDADLMSIAETNWIGNNIYGLSKEMNLSAYDITVGNISFFENAVFNTVWGLNFKRDNMDNIIDNLNTMKKIYEIGRN
jgi:hypothetical protein